MATGDIATIRLTRHHTSQPFGFKMRGGIESGLPIFIAEVTQKSKADTAGLREGDEILRIGDTEVAGLSYQQAQALLIRAGNDWVLTVKRRM